MNNIIIEFIPILLLFLLVSYTDRIVNFSNSVLGKLSAMIIIIMYSTIDTIHGLSVCLIFILYYMSNYVENMLNREGLTSSSSDSASKTDSPTKTTSAAPTTAAPTTAAPTTAAPTTAAPTTAAPTTAAPTTAAPTTKAKDKKTENFETLQDAYGKSPAYNKNNEAAKEMFKKQYCERGHLIYKGQVVNKEMSEHIFPEIKLNHEKCNLCDPTCDFSIKDEHMRIENDLMKPKDSNDWFEYMKQMFS